MSAAYTPTDPDAKETRSRPLTTDDIRLRIRKLRTEINAHAGDLEVVDYDPETGKLRLRFLGACVTCHARALTFATAILPLVSSIPGVASVQVENFEISDKVVDRIQSMLVPVELRRSTAAARDDRGKP